MNVSAWSIRNPIPSVLLFIMLTLGGLMGFNAMKVQQFPDIDLPTVVVSASLPGASPAQLETEVARKIENSIANLQGLKHIYTKVQDGTATITAEFRLEKPTQQAVDDVRDAVSRVRSDLPADLRDPVVSKVDLAGSPILTYTVASSRMDDEALSWFVDNNVTKTLLSVRGVGAVSRVGGVTREVRVELDPARLQACARYNRKPRAAAPTWAVPSSRCAPSPRCSRPTNSRAWKSRWATAAVCAWTRWRR
jgi:multidrug efflux pump subunit AcrB